MSIDIAVSSNEFTNDKSDSEVLLKAKASKAFHSGNYAELFRIIIGSQFSDESKKQLQNYWLQAHYVEAERIRGKPLGPVEKYRIRKKHPMPQSIWDGENKNHCFQENIRHYLHHQYLEEPYPPLCKKKEMSIATGLSTIQVSNWFKNRRQRDRAAIGKSRGGSTCEERHSLKPSQACMSPTPLVDGIPPRNLNIPGHSKGFNVVDLFDGNEMEIANKGSNGGTVYVMTHNVAQMQMYYYQYLRNLYQLCNH